MDDEKLIDLVSKYPLLYDLTNPKYMDTNFKNTIWRKIGAECQATGPACKTRWSNIRDNYRKSLKKNKTMSGQQAKPGKQYRYSQQLSFLTKFMEVRETTTNINDEVHFTEDTKVCESVSLGKEENTGDNITKDDNPVTLESQSRPPSKSNERNSAENPAPRKKAKQSALPPKTAALPVMEYIAERNEAMGSFPTPPQHPVDAFLAGIAPALKKLPPRDWHYAKADIFGAVQKYEFKMLMDQQQFAEPPLITTSPSTYSSTPSP